MDASRDADRPGFADEDRLPWLESADDDYSDRPPAGRVILLVVVGLALIAAAVWAVASWRSRGGATGSGELIQAPDGDYKIKPDEPGGMKVEGEGDTVFAASEGGKTEGTINTRAVPEAPVAGKAAAPAPKPGAGTTSVTTNIPATGGRLTAQAPVVAVPRAVARTGGSSLVQLGSFPSEGSAKAAWAATSRRFNYVAALGQSIEKAEVNGRTVYRLRVNAGSADNARDICGKLKVAGESCFVPN